MTAPDFHASRKDDVAMVLCLPLLTCVLLAAFHITAYPLAAWLGAFVVWLSMKGEG